MKKLMLTLIFCGLPFMVNSQSVSVEKSTSGIQTGFLGAWYYNEFKLSNTIAFRAEVGFGFDFSGFTVYETNLSRDTFGMAPVFTIEPRWYYNLNKRNSKSRKIAKNSGNFFSIKTTYYPDWFIITFPEFDNAFVSPQLSIIPTWGIKRHIGNHFNYEAGFGLGYRHNFDFIREKGSLDVNLHFRLGYSF